MYKYGIDKTFWFQVANMMLFLNVCPNEMLFEDTSIPHAHSGLACF